MIKSFSMDWKSLVKNIAPTLGAALGSPMGGAATRFLAEKFLGDPSADESQLAEALLAASPGDLQEIRRLDKEFRVEMRKLDVDVFKLETQDRDSARSLASKTSMVPQIILSVLYSIAYGVVLYAFMTGKITVPESQQVLFGSLIGILTGAQVQILNFWFGSSSGSKQKDAIKPV